MAYWPIASNAKRSFDHYRKHLALSLEMLAGQKLYFISGNNSVLASVEELCRQNNVSLHIEKILIDELPKKSSMDTLLMRAKNFGAEFASPPTDFKNDKGLIHYWRDLRQTGEDGFREIFCVWHSKIGLLHKASRDNPFSSTEFAWVDASISRMNGQRPGWDFRQVRCETPGVIYHYPSVMRKNGSSLALSAGVLIGDGLAIDRLYEGYEQAFRNSLVENYPNDEETVLDGLVRQLPHVFSAIRGEQSPVLPQTEVRRNSTSVGGRPKILVVGTFRSGTNAMKACLEEYFDVDVTFNEWFWKHGLPPTGIQNPVPPDVPIVVMVKSPFAFHESLYPFWQHRRPKLDSGPDVSSFARKELQVFDVSGFDLSRPKYWYRWPIEYWSQFYFSWLSWTEVRPRCQFVRYEGLESDTEREILGLAERFQLRRRKPGPISLPSERVGPHVPTERRGKRYFLNEADKQWIRERVNTLVARSLGYSL